MHILNYIFSLFNQYVLASSKAPVTKTSTHGDIDSGTSHEALETI